jgi:inorganic pyrophosphatase
LSRALTLGLSYPFDWGFIPGTEAENGDPVERAGASRQRNVFPGVLLACRALGVVNISQKEKGQDAKSVADPDADWHE